MTEFTTAGIVIPTRNRAELAQNAIRSVLEQPSCKITVVVSDNSTIPSEVDRLKKFCNELDDKRVKYVRPPKAMAMANHWEWALAQILQIPNVSHVLYLTDRMIFRRN